MAIQEWEAHTEISLTEEAHTEINTEDNHTIIMGKEANMATDNLKEQEVMNAWPVWRECAAAASAAKSYDCLLRYILATPSDFPSSKRKRML